MCQDQTSDGGVASFVGELSHIVEAMIAHCLLVLVSILCLFEEYDDDHLCHFVIIGIALGHIEMCNVQMGIHCGEFGQPKGLVQLKIVIKKTTSSLFLCSVTFVTQQLHDCQITGLHLGFLVTFSLLHPAPHDWSTPCFFSHIFTPSPSPT